jgi:hypothetical protein
MSWTVYIAWLVWVPLVLALFVLTKPRRAALIAIISGFLFLPNVGYPITGFKTKLSITCLVIVLASLIFAPGSFARLRPKLADLPILGWCLWPFVADRANGFEYYESSAAIFDAFLSLGAAYLLGRLFFTDLRGLRTLAIGIFVGGLIYVPFCLWEIRFSPQLHRMIYGFQPTPFHTNLRLGGYRPSVFLDHGLTVGMWMTAACLLGFLIWRSGSLRRLWGAPVGSLLVVLFLTTALCKSFGALALLACGLPTYWLSRRFRTAIPVLCLAAAAPLYMALRISGAWSGESLAVVSAQIGSEERADSLRFRLQNEELLIARAMQKKFTGWGRWGRSLIRDEEGRQISIPDGLWIITLGQFGLVGLTALTALLLLPILLLLRRYPIRMWGHPLVAPAAGLAIVVTLFMIDNLFNAMINPVFVLAAGGLAGLSRQYSPSVQRRLRSPRKAPALRAGAVALASRGPGGRAW